MVELKGIVRYAWGKSRHVQLVVADDSHVQNVVHEMGVDNKVNRGKILTFLAGIYGIPPGEIYWPEHIKAEKST